MGDKTTLTACPPERELRCSVVWDELAPGRTDSGPPGGTLLFLWPHLRDDRRHPDWARRPGDDDEYQPWWNREDARVSAALLRPFYEKLLAFLSARAGPPRFHFLDRFRALRRALGHFETDRRLSVLSDAIRARPTPLEELTALVEGAEGNDRSACTVAFGTPDAALLHARHNERCLWLWLAPAVRQDFDRFREEASGSFRFLQTVMDWTQTGAGLPAPRPPRTLRR
jgi:hypothetical protein